MFEQIFRSWWLAALKHETGIHEAPLAGLQMAPLLTACHIGLLLDVARSIGPSVRTARGIGRLAAASVVLIAIAVAATNAWTMALPVAALVLAAFGAYSTWVVATRGYIAFLEVGTSDRWAFQMLLDLVIACWFAMGWVRADARKRGINPWPYLVVVIPAGSIGLLAYCVRRAFSPVRG